MWGSFHAFIIHSATWYHSCVPQPLNYLTPFPETCHISMSVKFFLICLVIDLPEKIFQKKKDFSIVVVLLVAYQCTQFIPTWWAGNCIPKLILPALLVEGVHHTNYLFVCLFLSQSQHTRVRVHTTRMGKFIYKSTRYRGGMEGDVSSWPLTYF